jgi:hypothetical protein
MVEPSNNDKQQDSQTQSDGAIAAGMMDFDNVADRDRLEQLRCFIHIDRERAAAALQEAQQQHGPVQQVQPDPVNQPQVIDLVQQEQEEVQPAPVDPTK